MRAYYYLIYALRRLSGDPLGERGFREWRATFLLLLVEIRLSVSIAYLLVPSLMQHERSVPIVVGIGLAITALTHFVLENRPRYARHVAVFDSWSSRKRLTSDFAAAAFSVFAVVSPVLVRSILNW
jgi:hypothetical protein